MSLEELEAVALQLPSHERARLAEMLIASLDDDDEIAAAWAGTADRRFEELRSGVVRGVPLDEALAHIRSKLQ